MNNDARKELLLLVLFFAFVFVLVSRNYDDIIHKIKQVNIVTKENGDVVVNKNAQNSDKPGRYSNNINNFPLRINKFGTCTKGKGLDRAWLREEFSHFIKVYDQRPKEQNIYGTKMMHQFAVWATIRYGKTKLLLL